MASSQHPATDTGVSAAAEGGEDNVFNDERKVDSQRDQSLAFTSTDQAKPHPLSVIKLFGLRAGKGKRHKKMRHTKGNILRETSHFLTLEQRVRVYKTHLENLSTYIYKTKYFRLRLTDEVFSERPKRDLRGTWD